jgi:hypothetical protein
MEKGMTTNDHQQSASAKGDKPSQDKQVLEDIAQALTGLRFGSIEIVVHDGRVTQIERKEKFRLN